MSYHFICITSGPEIDSIIKIICRSRTIRYWIYTIDSNKKTIERKYAYFRFSLDFHPIEFKTSIFFFRPIFNGLIKIIKKKQNLGQIVFKFLVKKFKILCAWKIIYNHKSSSIKREELEKLKEVVESKNNWEFINNKKKNRRRVDINFIKEEKKINFLKHLLINQFIKTYIWKKIVNFLTFLLKTKIGYILKYFKIDCHKQMSEIGNG